MLVVVTVSAGNVSTTVVPDIIVVVVTSVVVTGYTGKPKSTGLVLAFKKR